MTRRAWILFAAMSALWGLPYLLIISLAAATGQVAKIVPVSQSTEVQKSAPATITLLTKDGEMTVTTDHPPKVGDVITADGRQMETPVVLEPGVADGIASLTLGFGRRSAGAIGNGVGTNAFAIRTATHRWTIPEVTIAKTGRRDEVLTTQNVVRKTS